MRNVIALLVVTSVALTINAHAGIPREISYQGVVRDAQGNVVPGPQTLDFTFRVYESESAGTVIWEESKPIIVTDGIFNTSLGDAIALDLPFDRAYWLSVQIGTESELPRIKLASAPYSFRAAVADSALSGGAGDSDWVVVGEDMHSGVPGNVGIGTEAPATLFHILGDSEGEGAMDGLLIDQTGAGDAALSFRLPGTEQFVVGIDNTDDKFKISDGANFGVSRLAVDVEGNVGIGTTDPDYKLDVDGMGRFRGGLLPGNTTYIKGEKLVFLGGGGMPSGNVVCSTGDDLYLQTVTANNNIVLMPDGDGRVGVGNAAPLEKLDIAGTVRASGFKMPTGAASGRVLTSDSSGTGTWQSSPGGGIGGGGTAGYVPKFTATTTIGNSILYEAGSNVGVGVTNPGSKLDINGDVRVRGADIRDAGGTPRVTLTDNGRLDLKEDGGSAALSVATNGYVGVARTSPSYQLDVGGDAMVRGTTSGGLRAYRIQVLNASWGAGGPTTLSVVNNNAYNTNPLVKFEQQNGSASRAVLKVEQAGAANAICAETNASTDEKAAVYAEAYASSGNTKGVTGITHSGGTQYAGGNPAGVYGWAVDTGNGDSYGVLGRCWNSLAPGTPGWDAPAGVFGWADVGAGLCWGVWGENRSATGTAAQPTAGVRGLSVSTTGVVHGVEGETRSASGLGVHAIGGMSSAGIVGIEVTSDGRRSMLYAIGSTENWFEDFGSGQLAGGRARVDLDSRLLGVVDIQHPDDFKVFLTPTSDDVVGQLAAIKSSSGFEVVDTGGPGMATFDYRIVAPRKGYRGIRMAPTDSPRPDLTLTSPGAFSNGHAIGIGR